MNTETLQTKPSKLFDFILAIITWSAIVFQFAYASNYANTISYFTILSNLAIAVCLTFILLFPQTKTGKFFLKISVQSSLVLYIIIVSLIYNVFLRDTWLQSFPRIYYDNIVHVVTPLLYVLRWIIYIPKGRLKWMDSIKWLSFPFAYLLYSIIRGYIINWYPYFFIDLTKITISELLLNSFFVLILFLLIGSIIISVDHLLGKKVKKMRLD